MIKQAICKLVNRENLSFNEAKAVFDEIFDHQVTPSQIAAFLIALKMKGETEDEIYAAAMVISARANKVKIRNQFIGIEDRDEPILDTCGTGGSGTNKFNISTAVAFVVSAAGVKIAKHGNKAMSSTCGSADVLEALGVKIDVNPAFMAEAIKKVGIGFLFAPLYHPALREVAVVRREMGTRTIFNVLGPLCNPACVSHQLLGVYDRRLIPVISGVLKKIGLKKAFVVYGKDLKDEVSLTGETEVAFLNNKRIEHFTLKPSDFGLRKVSLKDLEAKDAQASAKIIKGILDGAKGAPRDVVLAGASCCFFILGKVKSFKEGVKLAARLIDEGKAKQKLAEFIKFLNAASNLKNE